MWLEKKIIFLFRKLNPIQEETAGLRYYGHFYSAHRYQNYKENK